MNRFVTEVDAPQDGLLPAALPRAEHTDAFATALLPGDPVTPEGWASMTLAAVPPWVGAAMVLRDAVVAPFGLKTSARGAGRTPGFPELARTEHEILYGVDDRHLDFRAVLRVADGQATFVTAVRVNNPLGRAYWAVVRRIHPVLVRSIMRSARPRRAPAM